MKTPRHLPRFLLIETGTPEPAIVAAHGDYPERFLRALGHPERFTRVAAHQGAVVPELGDFDGVLVTGSPLSVCTPESWMMPLAERLAVHAERGGAVLGVCFGLQLMSQVRGAPVIVNPRGREIGTIRVRLTPAGEMDDLFGRLPVEFLVQATHSDVASRVPRGAVVMAQNFNSPFQAFRFGRRAWATQFHPELEPAILKGVIQSRRDKLVAEGLDPLALERGVRATPVGIRLLKRFEALI
jgi:GMP synthase (glutamine-hydrolysing)